MGAIRAYQETLIQVASQKRLWLSPLGFSDGYPIWLVRSRLNRSHKDPKILIVSAFHGEESAGPYAILQWLKDCDPKAMMDYDISFLPIVNPGAFAKGTRYNSLGEVSNAGFCHFEIEGNEKSTEGKILADNIDLLKPMAKDGYLSLHEDASEKRCYLYSFEEGTEPSDFTLAMKKELGKHFNFVDGDEVEVDGRRHKKVLVDDGLVFNFCDGSFDDAMFHLGVPHVFVSETPGRKMLKRRVEAGVAVINKFIELILEGEE